MCIVSLWEPLAHPAEAIRGSYSRRLEGKCVVLGVTGSVAAYKAVDTARWLVRRGARVVPVLTEEAARLVSPQLFEWATGSRAYTRFSGEVGHIALARECDGAVVAPATLSTLAKIAYGIVDNPVALAAVSLLGMGKPVLVAPAMHYNMMQSPQYRRAVELLAGQGVMVIPPYVAEGVAKYPDPGLVARIAAAAIDRGRDLEGARVVVTAGPTREWLDMVRFISNPSSGLMGVEVALEAYARGASVKLVHGPICAGVPHLIESVRVETTEEMAEALAEASGEGIDVLVAAAAPVDFRPASRVEGKIKSGSPLELRLEPTPKTLASLRRRPRVLVAFAAEATASEAELARYAVEKAEKYGADLVVANPVGPGVTFATAESQALLVYPDGRIVRLGRDLKENIARVILDEASRLLRTRGWVPGLAKRDPRQDR